MVLGVLKMRLEEKKQPNSEKIVCLRQKDPGESSWREFMRRQIFDVIIGVKSLFFQKYNSFPLLYFLKGKVQ